MHLLINDTLWDLSNGSIVAGFDRRLFGEGYQAISYRPNEEVTESEVNAASEHLIAMGVQQGDRYGVVAYDTNNHTYHRVFLSDLDSPTWIGFSSDSSFLLVRDKSTVFLWEIANDRLVFSAPCVDAGFSSDGDHLAIASETQTTVYSLHPSFQRLASLPGRAQRVMFLSDRPN